MRALTVFTRLFPFVLAFIWDRRRFFIVGRPRRRDAGRHRRRAERLTGTLAELGPTFIKLAQVFAARADILPEPYLTAIGTLTDRVPPLPAGVELSQQGDGLTPEGLLDHGRVVQVVGAQYLLESFGFGVEAALQPGAAQQCP